MTDSNERPEPDAWKWTTTSGQELADVVKSKKHPSEPLWSGETIRETLESEYSAFADFDEINEQQREAIRVFKDRLVNEVFSGDEA